VDRLRLTLLGSFQLVRDDAPVHLPLSAQRVIAFVALQDRPIQRSYVAGSLWLDSGEERAHACLRSALWRLHRAGNGAVDASGQRLALGAEVAVDLRESEALAWRALGAADCDLAAGAFRNDLLPDWYDDWVVPERERYRQLRLRALDALCERLTKAGRLGEALDIGLAAVAAEPLRETAHRAVVLVHLADGNVGEAMRHYRLCRRLFNEQLGIEPSERLRQLVPRC
jgi:DNA-binding SARP family transcriptional activator